MSQIVRLSPEDVSSRLQSLPGWKLVDGKLFREFTFDSFVTAFAFMTRVAAAAERLSHHPEWFNVWNRVEIRLVTHDASGISELDFALAGEINDALSGFTLA